MNKYSYTFKVKCPNDGELITYQLSIASEHTIMCEDIVKHCNHSSGYQEYIATYLKDKVGGNVTLSATHCGVKVVSIR